MSMTTDSNLLTRGRLIEIDPERIVLAVAGTDYQVHLVLDGELPSDVEVHDWISGVVRADAQRADLMKAGGRFIEPVYGRPRRIQGCIIGGDVSANIIVVDCGIKVHAKLMPLQKAGDFATEQLVGFDIEAGATFTPATSA